MVRSIFFAGLLISELVIYTTIATATPSVTLSINEGPPTTRILVSGGGFRANSKVDICFDTTRLAAAVTNAEGGFANVIIFAPPEATPGRHRVTVFERKNRDFAEQFFLVETDWRQAHFTPDLRSWNPYENVINAGNVGNLQGNWKFSSGYMYGTPAVADGTVYIGVEDVGMYALDAYTGAMKWLYAGNVDNSAAVDDRAVYFAAWDLYIHALDRDTGAVLWLYGSTSPRNVTLANGIVFVDADWLYALDARSGSVLWTAPSAKSDPAVSNGIVYVGGPYVVEAFDASSGKLLWSSPTRGEMYFISVSDGVVFASGGDGNLYALDAGNGNLRWSFRSIGVPSPVALAGRVAYFGSARSLYALDADTGIILWKYEYPSGALVRQLTVANSLLYVGTGCDTAGGDISVLNTQTGAVLWRYPINGGVCGLAVANGTLYFTGYNGTLYSFGLSDSAPLSELH